MEAIRDYGEDDVVVHVCASSEIFGRVPKDKLPIDEECSIHPASPYAISKVGTDLLGRYYAESIWNDGNDNTNVYTYRSKKR